jgi:ribonuclease P protein component
MLPRAMRLRKNFQFRYIYAHGTVYRSPALILTTARAKHPQSLKVGIAVSNKIGKAVFRNRVKRLIRAAVYAARGSLTAGYSYVFSASQHHDFSAFTLADADGAVIALLERFAKNPPKSPSKDARRENEPR